MVYYIDMSSFSSELSKKIVAAEKKIFITDKLKRGGFESLCARVLLGYILYKHYSIESFSYFYGETGKPYLENKDIFFSISHSGKYVACCVSVNEIGCDIEKVKAFNPKVVKRFFTEKEAALIESFDEKEVLFTSLWTLKESILKKDGSGIGGGLDTYCFADNALKDSFFAFDCYFLCTVIGDSVFSLCSKEKHTISDIKEVSYEELCEYIAKLTCKTT